MRALILSAALVLAAAGPAAASKLTDAEAAFAAGRDDEALALYSQALETPGMDEETRASALFGRGEVYALSGRRDEAIADFTAALALERDPVTRASLLFSRAEAYGGRRQYDEALSDYGESIRLAPDLVGVYVARGAIYRRLGRDDEALADFEAELQRNPASGRAQAARAELLGLPIPQYGR